MILLPLQLMLLSYHGLLSSEEVQKILLIQSPTSADYLSICSFWKHIGKNREYLNCLTNLIFNLHAKNIHSTVDRDGLPLPLSIFLMVEMAISDMSARISFTQKLHSVYIMYICEICFRISYA